jgi:hypothetical protein
VTPDNISPIQRNPDQGMREKLKKKPAWLPGPAVRDD